VLLSYLYLHYTLDLWFERVVKVRLPGEAHLLRYIDDFVICFQYRSDALRVQDALRLRLEKFGLTLEPNKTKLVEFGRFAQRHAGKRGRKRPETNLFSGPDAVLHSKNGSRSCDQSCTPFIGSCKRSGCCKATAEERGAGKPHATFCGNRRWPSTSGDPVPHDQVQPNQVRLAPASPSFRPRAP
jgi:hypothetical protein